MDPLKTSKNIKLYLGLLSGSESFYKYIATNNILKICDIEDNLYSFYPKKGYMIYKNSTIDSRDQKIYTRSNQFKEFKGTHYDIMVFNHCSHGDYYECICFVYVSSSNMFYSIYLKKYTFSSFGSKIFIKNNEIVNHDQYQIDSDLKPLDFHSILEDYGIDFVKTICDKFGYINAIKYIKSMSKLDN